MEKKILKFYESPAVESVEVDLEGSLLDASFDPIVWGAREVPSVEDEEE
jgi:hypothetical protein